MENSVHYEEKKTMFWKQNDMINRKPTEWRSVGMARARAQHFEYK